MMNLMKLQEGSCFFSKWSGGVQGRFAAFINLGRSELLLASSLSLMLWSSVLPLLCGHPGAGRDPGMVVHPCTTPN